MLRTGIPASYWDAAPGAEVRTVLDMLERQADESAGHAAASAVDGDVLISGSQRRR